jgi:A/G-specific adenine glycosylase
VAVRHRGQYLLRRRSEGERWAGLWDFPRFAVASGQRPEPTLIEGVREQTGLAILPGEQIAEWTHGVTRYRITLHCFTATVRGGRLLAGDHLAWTPPAEFERFPLSVTGRKFARLLSEEKR